MLSEWDGKVPLLGFEGEHHEDQAWEDGRRTLYIPVKRCGCIAVYAWTKQHAEGYNILWPDAPLHPPTGQAKDPFTAKMIIQAYFNRLDHYLKTGEIDYAYELQSSRNGRQA